MATKDEKGSCEACESILSKVWEARDRAVQETKARAPLPNGALPVLKLRQYHNALKTLADGNLIMSVESMRELARAVLD